MEAAKRLARLPGNLHDAPLAARALAYLILPSRFGQGARWEERRDAEYRALLPRGARTSDGTEYTSFGLRRAVHSALMNRAACELDLLRGAGHTLKARQWQAAMKEADESYRHDNAARRNQWFRCRSRSRKRKEQHARTPERHALAGAAGMQRAANPNTPSARQAPPERPAAEGGPDEDSDEDVEIAMDLSLSMLEQTPGPVAAAPISISDEEVVKVTLTHHVTAQLILIPRKRLGGTNSMHKLSRKGYAHIE